MELSGQKSLLFIWCLPGLQEFLRKKENLIFFLTFWHKIEFMRAEFSKGIFYLGFINCDCLLLDDFFSQYDFKVTVYPYLIILESQFIDLNTIWANLSLLKVLQVGSEIGFHNWNSEKKPIRHCRFSICFMQLSSNNMNFVLNFCN